jgi:hypothetical protein
MKNNCYLSDFKEKYLTIIQKKSEDLRNADTRLVSEVLQRA